MSYPSTRSSSLSLQASTSDQKYPQENKKIFSSSASELPENKPAMLLSAVYSGEEQKVYLKFYNDDDQGIFFWRDRTNHRPYCYTKMDYLDDAEKIIQKEKKYSSQRIKKVDLIADKEIELLKIISSRPTFHWRNR